MLDNVEADDHLTVILLFLFSAKLRQFLVEFHIKEGRRKNFKYASQLTLLAHREQVLLTIDLDDVGRCCLE